MQSNLENVHDLSPTQQLVLMYLSNNHLVSTLSRRITHENSTTNNGLIEQLLTSNVTIKQQILELTRGRQRYNQQLQPQPQPNHPLRHVGHGRGRFHRNNNHNNTENVVLTTREYDIDILRLFSSLGEPISLPPTPSQIEDATSRIRYGDIVTALNDTCPISLNRFQENDIVTMIRHCGHVFTSSELNNWFATDSSCPVCRHDIRLGL